MFAQSERGKQSSTCAYRLLDNHVVISESRCLVCAVWSDNGFQKDNTTFTGLQKHNLFTSYFIIEKNAWTTLFGARGGEQYYAYSAEARPNENVCAALSERLPSDYLRIRRRSGISGEQYREKRYCLPCAYNKLNKRA